MHHGGHTAPRLQITPTTTHYRLKMSGGISSADAERVVVRLSTLRERADDATLRDLLQPATLDACANALDSLLSVADTAAAIASSEYLVLGLDAERLANLLELVTHRPELGELSSREVARMTERVTLLTNLVEETRTAAGERDQQAAIDRAAERYVDDARAERRSARCCAAGSVAALGGSMLVAYWAWSNVLEADTKHPRLALLLPAVVCVSLCLVSALLIRAMNVHDRARREYLRMQRGLEGLGPWLAPLPHDARHLLRITMTQSLFPRLFDDDALSQRDQWPSDSTVLQSIYGVTPEDLESIYAAQRAAAALALPQEESAEAAIKVS